MQAELAYEEPALQRQVKNFQKKANVDQQAVFDKVTAALAEPNPEVISLYYCYQHA